MFHKNNRKKLIEKLGGGLIVVSGYDAMQLSGDMEAPFVQEANFWWLTGINKAGWKVIIDSSRNRATLVRPHIDAIHAVFNGEMSDDDARDVSGADEIITADEFESRLRQLRRSHTVVYSVQDKNSYGFVANPAPRELGMLLARVFVTVDDCGKQLAELRAIKQPEEIVAMKKAIALTIKTFKTVRAELSKYKHEYEIEADFTRAFRRANATHAYEPIIARGENACTLHYIDNTAKLLPNKGVLIDIGAKVDGYCADITRTYVVKPTKRQQEVHGAVEYAHKRIIALIAPNLPVLEYHQQVDEIMKDALQEVGLLAQRDDNETYRKYFPHAISHGLGIDPHDPLGRPQFLRAGMVLTVEPGIYIPEEQIGVRIEDDILVTEDGHVNLSAGLPTSL